MSNPALQALRADYDKLKTEDERQVWRVAHMDGAMEELFNDSPEAQIDHSGLEEFVSGAKPKKARATLENLTDTLYSEFQERFGYRPSNETAKLAAQGFQGDIFEEDGRDAYYQRVAANDGRLETNTERFEPNRTQGVGGGSLAARMSAATEERQGADYGEGDTGDWMRELSTMRAKGGVR